MYGCRKIESDSLEENIIMSRDFFHGTMVRENGSPALLIDRDGRIVCNETAASLISPDDTAASSSREVVENSAALIQYLRFTRTISVREVVIKGTEFVILTIPLNNCNGWYGNLCLFIDHPIQHIPVQQYHDGYCADVLNTVFNTTHEWVVVVDEKCRITMMSKAYKEFLGEPHPEGKPVTDVIENTRMHRVVATGIEETGDIQEIKGNRMIAMRIPIKKEGKVIGAVGKVIFKDISDFYALSKKIKTLTAEVEYYKKELRLLEKGNIAFECLHGHNRKLQRVAEEARMAAKGDSTILVTGESGTGKELLVHAIHNSSPRKSAPLIKINCAAIPAELLESELFGYEEGAFTGARHKGKPGKFEIAHGGTIFLDEIGDMPPDMQAKLLRVVQEKEIERVGGSTLRKVDVRIIAATNCNLEKMVEEKRFRRDLFYRLDVVSLALPPLRERKDDIPEISRYLMKRISGRLNVYVETISSETMEYLQAFDWPGNIRELENVIERAINLLDGDIVITPKHLPERITRKRYVKKFENRSLKEIIGELEREVILSLLKEHHGNKNRVARQLGISRTALYEKLKGSSHSIL